MKRLIPLFILLFLAAGAAYFLITARLVGRHLLSSVSEPTAFAGPELVNNYTLARGLRGPESFIESPSGAVVVPAPPADLARIAVVRIAVLDRFIMGEIADLSTGQSRGFFLLDTADANVKMAPSETAWRELARTALQTDPPALLPADSFTGPGEAP